jgi:hypothetical protein
MAAGARGRRRSWWGTARGGSPRGGRSKGAVVGGGRREGEVVGGVAAAWKLAYVGSLEASCERVP